MWQQMTLECPRFVVVEQKGDLLMLVGRGYTSKGPGGIPPITMRRLTSVTQHSAPAFSHEELGKLVVGSYSEYNNHFVKAFSHNNYVYFVFSRRDVWGKREYRTYVSRLCAGDPNFYSYVEVPLSCGGGYNLAQAAVLGYHREQPMLFVAMAMGQASTPTPQTGRLFVCTRWRSWIKPSMGPSYCVIHRRAKMPTTRRRRI